MRVDLALNELVIKLFTEREAGHYAYRIEDLLAS